MQTVKTIGLDIAKSVFQVHGIDAYGQVVGLRSPELVDLRWEQIDLDTQSCTFVESNRHTGDDTFDRPRNYRFAPTRLRAYSVINAGFSCGMTNPTAAPILLGAP
jgi:integrase